MISLKIKYKLQFEKKITSIKVKKIMNRGNCPQGHLSAGGIVIRGNCPQGQLSQGQLSAGAIVLHSFFLVLNLKA